MIARFVHESDRVDFIPAQHIQSGDIIPFGDRVGIARLDISAETRGVLWLEGVYDLLKGEGVSVAFPFGSPVFWNPTTKKAGTTTGAGYLRIGTAAALEDTADAEFVRFVLNG